MKRPTLKVEKRKILGRKVKKLREEGILPANIYGKKVKSQAIEIDRSEFEKVFSEVGETGIIELNLGNEKRPVLVHNIQLEPVSDEPIHVDFHQVDLKQKVVANIPIDVLGESPAEKQGLGTLVQYFDEIEVEALPGDLPEKFEIDAGDLEKVDQAIFIKDLKVGDKVEVKQDPEEIIVKIEPPREEEEELPPAPVEGEEVVEGEEKEEAAPKGEEESKEAEDKEGAEEKKEK